MENYDTRPNKKKKKKKKPAQSAGDKTSFI